MEINKIRHIDSLIINYLENKLNDENHEDFEGLLRRSEELRKYMADFKRIWDGKAKDISNYNAQRALFDFKARIHAEEASRIRKRFLITRFSRIAAAVLLLFAVSFAMFYWGWQSSENTPIHTFTSFEKSDTPLLLPDGSKVWLNASSTICYKGQLDKKQRNIYLDGEAYFEVKSDEKHPFVVHAHGVKIKAVGTSFNVAAYGNDDYIKTSLIHGVLDFNAQSKHYRMKAGDIVLLNKKTRQYSYRQILQDEDVLAWQKGKMVFRNDKLGEIKGQLERAYDVKIELETPIEQIRFSGIFDDESLEEVLAILRGTIGVEVCRKEDTIFLKHLSGQ